jgi:hypothetical protein
MLENCPLRWGSPRLETIRPFYSAGEHLGLHRLLSLSLYPEQSEDRLGVRGSYRPFRASLECRAALYARDFHLFSEEDCWDYWKVFVDDMSYHEGHGRAYENYRIDPGTGCMIIIRPDQHVSWIGEMEDVDDMARFFSAFMVPQG